jgi:AraC family transcriptional regulator
MLREAAEPGFGGSLFAESMGMAVAVELARLDGRQLPRDGSRRGSLAYQQMRQLESYVHDHLSRHLTLNELAQLLGISVRYLSSAVKRAKGVSIHRWIAECRISEARRLLAETDLLIHEIARQCAFHSADAFSTAFRASFGCAPDEFRRLALGLSLTDRLGANP